MRDVVLRAGLLLILGAMSCGPRAGAVPPSARETGENEERAGVVRPADGRGQAGAAPTAKVGIVRDQEFPRTIAGVAMYMSPAEVAASCQAAGGATVAVASDGRVISLDGVRGHHDAVACVPPPFDPFETFNKTTAIGIRFCLFQGDPVACEIVFALRDQDARSSDAVLERLQGKYGAGADHAPPFSCPRSVDREQTVRRTWLFLEDIDGQPFPSGRIVAGHFCQAEVPDKPAQTVLVYQSTLEFLDRVEQGDLTNNNF